MKRLYFIVSAIVVSILSMIALFVRDLVQACSDALAPRDELYIKSLNPMLAIYRHGVIRELADRLNQLELVMYGIPQAFDRFKPKKRRWPVALECEGRAGTIQTTTINPQCLFRINKIIATDDENGQSTEITQIIVGNQLVLPVGLGIGIPTSEFAFYKINNEIIFPTCQPALMIAVSVRFLRDSKWKASMFGDAVV